ncbi:addiction module antidote protein, HigA family [Corallococcus sp. AB050B]|nr:addiction module antidote protein, HigA family [Corallococcus sp. AB050B]
MNENLKPARLVPPGAFLKRELDARGWSQRYLAEITGRPPQAISEIIKGTKQITPETAIDFADVLGTSAEFWLNLESRYRLQLAQRNRSKLNSKESSSKDSKEKLSAKARLKSKLDALVPVAELLKRGWIRRVSGAGALEKELCKFLGVDDIEEKPQLSTSWRHSQARNPQGGAQLAWLKRVEAVAKEQKVGAFSRTRLENAVPALLEFMDSPERIPVALGRLNSLGVRVAFVEHLPKSYVDGAAFTLDDGSAVVGVSLRYDRIDHFWFTLLHELAHIVSSHKGVHLDNFGEKGVQSSEEQEANALAQNWIFPREYVDRFVSETREEGVTRAAIEKMAAKYGRHPGLLVGQLQYRKEIMYSEFRDMLVPVKVHVKEWLS